MQAVNDLSLYHGVCTDNAYGVAWGFWEAAQLRGPTHAKTWQSRAKPLWCLSNIAVLTRCFSFVFIDSDLPKPCWWIWSMKGPTRQGRAYGVNFPNSGSWLGFHFFQRNGSYSLMITLAPRFAALFSAVFLGLGLPPFAKRLVSHLCLVPQCICSIVKPMVNVWRRRWIVQWKQKGNGQVGKIWHTVMELWLFDKMQLAALSASSLGRGSDALLEDSMAL